MKKTIGIAVGILVLVVLAVFVFPITVTNRMVALDEGADAAWANVDAVLQRRYDLLPNLVNTVKGFAAHEREILEEVTRLRSQWSAAGKPAERVEAAQQMESALGRLMVIVERYPDLKANQNFLALQDELAGTENRISVERRRYNEAVRAFNTYIRSFPGSMFAARRGFERRTPFESAPAARDVPTVEF
ncbi:MAG: LemA family protein [Kiritimatiellia bacterium]|nr:LemA family protein [Kiritimatiellia bacterium]